MSISPLRWMITGANGNLGKRLVRALLDDGDDEVVAVVRSSRAMATLNDLELDTQADARLSVRVLDYADVEALHQVALASDRVVHLVGILKETRMSTYAHAHAGSTAALLQALKGTPVTQLTYMSIVGAHPESDNSCLASKGEAEELCRQAAIKTCVLRVPMVLGEKDYASYALRTRATKPLSFTFRAASLEQPIYAGDVVRAIASSGRMEIDATLDLAGPETLTRKALTARAAAVLGITARVVSLPLGLGLLLATLMEKFFANPPMTPTMLDVLDHDDHVDVQVACETLKLMDLTSLDDMLAAVLLT